MKDYLICCSSHTSSSSFTTEAYPEQMTKAINKVDVHTFQVKIFERHVYGRELTDQTKMQTRKVLKKLVAIFWY